MTTFSCQAPRLSEVCLFKLLGATGEQLQMISDTGLLFTSVVVHWIPATLSAISSPCHWASINQYALQADRGTCGENNMPCSHAYLNIQGLCVAADWAPHHCPAQPRKWKNGRRLGSLKCWSQLAFDSPVYSNWLHAADRRVVCVFFYRALCVKFRNEKNFMKKSVKSKKG